MSQRSENNTTGIILTERFRFGRFLAFSENKPNGLILTEPQIVATHEAGRAVAYAYYGYQHGGIRLIRDADGDVTGTVTSPAGRYDPYARGVCCLCGPAAEERLTGVDLFDQPASRTDIEMAEEALARIHAPDLDLVVRFARLLVRREWPAIGRIAAALLQVSTLSYEQCIKLYEESLSDGASCPISQSGNVIPERRVECQDLPVHAASVVTKKRACKNCTT